MATDGKGHPYVAATPLTRQSMETGEVAAASQLSMQCHACCTSSGARLCLQSRRMLATGPVWKSGKLKSGSCVLVLYAVLGTCAGALPILP